MKYYTYILMLIFVLPYNKANTQDFISKINADSILVGEPFYIQLSCQKLDDKFDIIIPDISPIEWLSTDTLDNQNQWIRKLQFICFDTGDFSINPIDVITNNQTLNSPSYDINVRLEESTIIKFPRDIKPILSPTFDKDSMFWIYLVLGLILIFGIITLLLFLKVKNQKQKIRIIEDNPIERLTKINTVDRVNSIKDDYSLVSLIIKDYISDRFQFPALEYSTKAVLEKIIGLVSNSDYERLKSILNITDKVKYSKNTNLDKSTLSNCINLSIEFIQNTNNAND